MSATREWIRRAAEEGRLPKWWRRVDAAGWLSAPRPGDIARYGYEWAVRDSHPDGVAVLIPDGILALIEYELVIECDI